MIRRGWAWGLLIMAGLNGMAAAIIYSVSGRSWLWLADTQAAGMLAFAAALVALWPGGSLGGHEHTYLPVAVEMYEPPPPRPMSALTGGEPLASWGSTVVLLRCECGALDTTILTGRWSLPQVLGGGGDAWAGAAGVIRADNTSPAEAALTISVEDEAALRRRAHP